MSSTKKNSVPVEPKSINDVFSWDIVTLRNYYTRFWPKRTPPKHKDSIRRALMEEFTERKLLTNAKTAYMTMSHLRGVPQSFHPHPKHRPTNLYHLFHRLMMLFRRIRSQNARLKLLLLVQR